MLARVAAVLCVASVAVCSWAGSALPVGTLNSTFGTARVSGVPVPSGRTVFSGDTIETGAAKAVFTFSPGGDSILLGPNARVRVLRSGEVPTIEVLKGMSRVQLRSKELKLVASKWTLQAKPDAQTGRAIADVLRDAEGAVSLNVQEGELVAKNAAGKTFAVAKAGRPTMLPASAVPAAASARPPQSSPAQTTAVLAAALAAAAIGVGIAAIAADDTTDDEARAAAAAAQSAAAQIDALVAQNAALQAQVAALQAQVAAMASQNEETQALIAQLGALQRELAQIAAETVAIGARIAAGTATPADLARLAALQARQNGIIGELGALLNLPPPVSP